MKKRFLGGLIAVVAFTAASVAQATVHRVYPGDSIQAAIDAASAGDTIIVEPGVYKERGNGRYGLRIDKSNIRLIGKIREKKGQGKPNRVRVLQNQDQETGVYAGPPGCDYDVKDDTPQGEECRAQELTNFYIRGFSVEGFPVNGIQTRWVDGFQFVDNHSVNNLNNGIYPTLSANGMVRDNVSYGSLDTAMWIAGSENVRVIGNELHSSVIGFEITVSNEVEVTANRIYNNTVGVGLFHPNGAGNPPLPVMANWVIEHNDIYDNNLSPNPAPPGTFQSVLPPGIGVLLSGVSDHKVINNYVKGNNYVGIAVLGWCSGLGLTPAQCQLKPVGDLRAPPGAENNLVARNYLSKNATDAGPPPGLPLPPADIVYAQPLETLLGYDTAGNCFEDNEPDGFTSFSWPPFPDGSPLPSDLPSDC